MYEFTCPRCSATSRVKELGGDAATPCPRCSQLLKLVPEEEAAEVLEVTAPAWWGSRGFLAACGAGGLVAAGLVVALAFVLARGTSTASDEPAALEENPEPELRAVRPRGKAPAPAKPAVARKPVPPEPPEKVIPLLESTNVGERERAARKLAAIGPPARAAVPKLLALLRNAAEPEAVRGAAGAALRAVGPPLPGDSAAAAAALADASCDAARRYAAGALGESGDAGQAPALARALGDPDAGVRALSATSLGRLGPPARAAGYEPLLGALRDAERPVRDAALAALTRVGNPDALPPALPRLLADASAPAEARRFAARAAGGYGAAAVPALAEALRAERDPALAVAFVRALGPAAADAPAAASTLVGALDSVDKPVRVAAAEGLRAAPLGPATLPGVLKALAAPDPDVRRAALRGLPLSSLVGDAPAAALGGDAVAALRPALASAAPEARLFAAAALGRLGPAAAPAAADLLKALGKEKGPGADRRVRLELLAAVAGLPPDALGAEVDGLLAELKEEASEADDANRLCRTAAALTLVRLAAADSPEAKAGVTGLSKALLLHNCAQPDPAEQALHDRARKALVKNAGKLAGPALAREYDLLLDSGPPAAGFPGVAGPRGMNPRSVGGLPRGPAQRLAGRPGAGPGAGPGVGLGAPTNDAAQDKLYARKALFQVLEEIGPAARCPAVRTLFDKATVRLRQRQEAGEVNDAAQAAYNAVYKKR